MARRAQLKTIHRKTKIVLTFRGRKVFGAKDYEHILQFKRGWYLEETRRRQLAELPSFDEAMQDPAKAHVLLVASKGGNVPGITEDHRGELARVLVATIGAARWNTDASGLIDTDIITGEQRA